MTISYQLYCSRNFPPLEGTLSMLNSVGINSVEGFGAMFGDLTDPDSLKATLDAAEMKMPTGHVAVADIKADPEKVIAFAKAVGLREVNGPFIMPDERPTDAAGWEAFGQEFAEAAKPLMDAGLTVGWHNHDFEFQSAGSETLPIEFILGASDDLAFEFDVAWAVRADVDPMDWIKRYSGRIKTAHMKDIAEPGQAVHEDGWADLGHGVMDWPALFAALKTAGTTNFVIEHDNPSDHRRFATRSLATLKELGA